MATEASARSNVLGHLVHGVRADWIPRLHIILEHGPDRPFEPFDSFAMREESLGRRPASCSTSSSACEPRISRSSRKPASTRANSRSTARNPEFGPVTAQELIATWVVHDLGHLAQISRAMAFQYRDAVGPWRAYLSILPKAVLSDDD
jgi:hypothetical protein